MRSLRAVNFSKFLKCFKITRPREIKIICAKKSKKQLDQNMLFQLSGNSFRIQVQELGSFILQDSRKQCSHEEDICKLHFRKRTNFNSIRFLSKNPALFSGLWQKSITWRTVDSWSCRSRHPTRNRPVSGGRGPFLLAQSETNANFIYIFEIQRGET